jgi:hypothetical protein
LITFLEEGFSAGTFSMGYWAWPGLFEEYGVLREAILEGLRGYIGCRPGSGSEALALGWTGAADLAGVVLVLVLVLSISLLLMANINL